MRVSRIVLDYAEEVSKAKKVLAGYTSPELTDYQAGLLKAVELLQANEEQPSNYTCPNCPHPNNLAFKCWEQKDV